MEEEDIINYLFNKQDEDNSLALGDTILKNFNKKIIISEEKINNFINQKVHPQSRNQLRGFINNWETYFYKYLHRENQLYYRKGVSDAVQLIMTSLKTNYPLI